MGFCYDALLNIRMEVITRGSRFHVILTNDKVTKTLALVAILGVSKEDWAKLFDDLLMGDRGAVELVETLAVEASTKIQIIFAGYFTHQADLTQVWTATAIRATS